MILSDKIDQNSANHHSFSLLSFPPYSIHHSFPPEKSPLSWCSSASSKNPSSSFSHENYLSSKENPSENQSAPFFFATHSPFFLSKPLPPDLLFTHQPTCHLQPLPWPVMLPAMSMQLPQASGRGPPTYLQCCQLLQLVK